VWVTVSSAQRSPMSVRVQAGTLVLGRDPACDVVIADAHVSLRHAQLDVTPHGAQLADLQSKNGTFVAGDRIERPVWLPVPTEFRLGEATVRLTTDEPTALLDRARTRLPLQKPAPSSGGTAPPATPVSGLISDAGPVAAGDLVIRGGGDVAGRDLVIHEGLTLRTKMRSSARNLIRLGAAALLSGFGLFGYFIIAWNNEIFSVVTSPTTWPPPGLPSPWPWLPLGAGLMFVGLVLVGTGLLLPRDRIVTRSER
jgi:hypothetical protein